MPLGPKAFVPGKLIHTNEVLVMLGQNYFAEQSVPKALALIDRRKQRTFSLPPRLTSALSLILHTSSFIPLHSLSSITYTHLSSPSFILHLRPFIVVFLSFWFPLSLSPHLYPLVLEDTVISLNEQLTSLQTRLNLTQHLANSLKVHSFHRCFSL